MKWSEQRFSRELDLFLLVMTLVMTLVTFDTLKKYSVLFFLLFKYLVFLFFFKKSKSVAVIIIFPG